jgi:hypothetical protein
VTLTAGWPAWRIRPAAGSRCSPNLAVDLAGLQRREDVLAAIGEAVTIRRELADRWPDAYASKLEQSLRVADSLAHDSEDLDEASSRETKRQ